MPLNNPLVNDYPEKIKPATDRWVIPGWSGSDSSPGPVLVNTRIIYIPIFVSEPTNFIRIAVNVTTLAAGGTVELRIYEWDDGLPGVLILDAGSVITTNVAVVEIVINQDLGRGYYFLAYRADAAAAGAILMALRTLHGWTAPVPGVKVTAGTNVTCLLQVDGAWADPALAPTAIININACCVYLREN